jgi:hypothetical protein
LQRGDLIIVNDTLISHPTELYQYSSQLRSSFPWNANRLQKFGEVA